MKRPTTAILLFSFGLTLGCNSEPRETTAEDQTVEFPAAAEAPDPEPLPAPTILNAGSSAAGQLTGVNAGEETFQILLDDGVSMTFRYTDSTEVTGANGTQGLATREGRQATVYYDSDSDPPTATLIEIGP